MEGLAEQQSLGWDEETDLILRDAVVNNMLVSISRLEDLWNLHGGEYFMIYKEGQGFLEYIAQKYGPYKSGEILKLFARTRDFNNAFKYVIGKSQYDVYSDWQRYLKRQYWPYIKTKKEPGEFAKKLTDHIKNYHYYNSKPVWSPDGQKIAFLTDRDIFIGLYLMDAKTGKKVEQLVEGGRQPEYEEMNTRENSLSWSKDGRYLLFLSKSGQYDKINIYDFQKKKFLDPLNPKLDSLLSVSISADNKNIVFCGTKDGKCDLYVITFDGNN